ASHRRRWSPADRANAGSQRAGTDSATSCQCVLTGDRDARAARPVHRRSTVPEGFGLVRALASGVRRPSLRVSVVLEAAGALPPLVLPERSVFPHAAAAALGGRERRSQPPLPPLRR